MRSFSYPFVLSCIVIYVCIQAEPGSRPLMLLCNHVISLPTPTQLPSIAFAALLYGQSPVKPQIPRARPHPNPITSPLQIPFLRPHIPRT